MGRHPSRPRDRRPSPASARTASALGGRSASVRGHRRAGRARSPGDDAAGLNLSTVPLTGGGPLLRHLTDGPGSHGRTGQEAPSMPWPSTHRGHRGPATPMGQSKTTAPRGRTAGSAITTRSSGPRGPTTWQLARSVGPTRPAPEAPEARPHLPTASPTKPPLTTRPGSVNLGERVRTAMRITIEKGKVKSVWVQFSNYLDKDFGPISSLSGASAARPLIAQQGSLRTDGASLTPQDDASAPGRVVEGARGPPAAAGLDVGPSFRSLQGQRFSTRPLR
jgi:hypothetical protein